MQQKLSILQSELQLANERKRIVTQVVAEATQMAKIAQERAAKATERERVLVNLFSVGWFYLKNYIREGFLWIFF